MDHDKPTESLFTPPLESPPSNHQSSSEGSTSCPSVATGDDSPSHPSHSFSTDRTDELSQVTGLLPVLESLKNKYNLIFKRDKSSEAAVTPLHVSLPPNKKSRHDELNLPSDATVSESASSTCPLFSSVELAEKKLATGRLSVVDSLKSIYDNVFENDKDTDLPENSRFETLPDSLRPAFERICYHLHRNGENNDLNCLAQVSPRFHRRVKEFMTRKINRPAFKKVLMCKEKEGLYVEMCLFPSNLSFYNFENLDSGRFERTVESCNPILKVMVRGPEDPIIDQVSDLLSTTLCEVELYRCEDPFSMEDLSLPASLLRNSIIDKFDIVEAKMDDSSAQLVFSIISRSSLKEIRIAADSTDFSNPAAFITQLNSVSPNVFRDSGDDDDNFFYGLLHSFWAKFLNEKFKDGSIDYVEVAFTDRDVADSRFTKAPVELPDTPIYFLEWKKEAK